MGLCCGYVGRVMCKLVFNASMLGRYTRKGRSGGEIGVVHCGKKGRGNWSGLQRGEKGELGEEIGVTWVEVRKAEKEE